MSWEGTGVTLEVSVEGLQAAAAAVTGLGEDMALAHNRSDGRVEGALPGWRGRSAAALATRAALWAEASRVLLARLGEHAEALRTSAAEFSADQRRGAQALDSVR